MTPRGEKGRRYVRESDMCVRQCVCCLVVVAGIGGVASGNVDVQAATPLH